MVVVVVMMMEQWEYFRSCKTRETLSVHFFVGHLLPASFVSSRAGLLGATTSLAGQQVLSQTSPEISFRCLRLPSALDLLLSQTR